MKFLTLVLNKSIPAPDASINDAGMSYFMESEGFELDYHPSYQMFRIARGDKSIMVSYDLFVYGISPDPVTGSENKGLGLIPPLQPSIPINKFAPKNKK